MPKVKDNTVLMAIGGEPAGTLAGGVFTKHVDNKHHQFGRKPEILIDARAYDRIRGEAHTVVARDEANGITYSIATAQFDRHRRHLNRLCGAQYSVGVEHWRAKADK